MTTDRLSFKQMCDMFDVTPRTLRHYEYIELLFPEKEGRSRYYTPREVARMKLIMRGRRWGFSLEEIRQWLLIYDKEGTRQQMQTWVEMSARQLEILHEKKREMEQAIAELQDTHDEVKRDVAKRDT
jgi:DNA-binding transcriptional MerR regulator